MVGSLINHFKDRFEPQLLTEIETLGQLKSFKADAIIMDIGQNIRATPILLEGIIKIMRIDQEGREILLYYVRANESCAMTFTCCMQQKLSEIRAVAEEDCTLLMIPIAYMDKWMQQYPTWKSFVMHTIDARFNELLAAFDQVAFQKLDERLVHYLLEKISITGSSLVNLSHEQIARELASSRVVISRLLKQLELDGKVLLYRNQIKVLKGLQEPR